MKRFILIALLVPSLACAFTLPQIFTNQTTSRTSTTIDVSGYKTKTLHVYGKYSSAAYLNMSGTVAAKCGATKTGPFTTCNQSQLASTPAVSATTNSIISWQDAVQYVQIQWTRTKRAINVWLSGSPN